MCATKNCSNLPFVCIDEDCKCQSLHEDCLIQPVVSKLLDQILKKNLSASLCLNIILEFCEYGIKKFQICKEEIFKLMDQGGTLLEQEESALLSSFYTLRNDLTGDIVSRAVNSLQNNPIIKTTEI